LKKREGGILVTRSYKKKVGRSDLTNTNIKPESAKTWRPLKKFKFHGGLPPFKDTEKLKIPQTPLSLSHPLSSPSPSPILSLSLSLSPCVCVCVWIWGC
jgi:hypothetical protein